MTTAHRPTFDPARGKEAQRGPAYHQRLLPAHTVLKTRQEGQGTASETSRRDLRTQLLQAEAAHYSKSREEDVGTGIASDTELNSNRRIETGDDQGGSKDEEDIDTKRRKILEETRDVDADSDDSEEDISEEDSDEEDETAELMRELEKIKKERAEQREKEVNCIHQHHSILLHYRKQKDKRWSKENAIET